MSASNTIGQILKFTLFGESHGPAIGGVIDGFPAGFQLDMDFVRKMIRDRSPSNSIFETARIEEDEVEILSGIHENRTLGSPIAFIFRNKKHKSEDYFSLQNVFRPGHADYTYLKKYALKPQAGGGRASARETVARVFAGALAMDYLRQMGVEIISYVSAIGDFKVNIDPQKVSVKAIEDSVLRCPDKETEVKILELLEKISKEKDSIAGQVSSIIRNLPPALGEPVFNKINAALSAAVMSIPAVKGVEFGEGFGGTHLKGSEYNDAMFSDDEGLSFSTNHSGGIQGGISNGNDLIMKTVFRPASSIGKLQKTIDVNGKNVSLEVKGRHDVCFVPRAVPIVSSMIALSIMDMYLLNQAYQQ